MEMVELKKDGPLQRNGPGHQGKSLSRSWRKSLKYGGYFQAVQEGFFVDSAKYPERNGDGIARKIEGGVGYGYIFESRQKTTWLL